MTNQNEVCVIAFKKGKPKNGQSRTKSLQARWSAVGGLEMEQTADQRA